MKKSKRKLGLVMLTALVSGNMMGSGVFLLPASLAQIGSITLFSWVITSVGAILLALLFAHISILVPKPGGPYVYAERGFGHFIGFQTAYTYWVALWIGNAAISLAAVGYARSLFPVLTDPLLTSMTAIVLVWIFTFLNILGARVAGWFQVITFLCKLLPLLFIIIAGWWYFHPEYISQGFNMTKTSHWNAISHGAALTLWAFVGVESATVSAERAINPARDVPIATILGALIASVIYILSSYVIMGMIPQSELANSSSPFALAANQILGRLGNIVIALGAIISCVGTLNGWILIQGQVAMNAARDELFPRVFAKQNRFRVPMLALLTTSCFITVLLFLTISSNFVAQFNLIILLADFTILIPYYYTAIAYFVVQPHQTSYRMWLCLLMGFFAALYSYWVIMGAGSEIVYWGMLFILTSFPLYIWMKKHHR